MSPGSQPQHDAADQQRPIYLLNLHETIFLTSQEGENFVAVPLEFDISNNTARLLMIEISGEGKSSPEAQILVSDLSEFSVKRSGITLSSVNTNIPRSSSLEIDDAQSSRLILTQEGKLFGNSFSTLFTYDEGDPTNDYAKRAIFEQNKRFQGSGLSLLPQLVTCVRRLELPASPKPFVPTVETDMPPSIATKKVMENDLMVGVFLLRTTVEGSAQKREVGLVARNERRSDYLAICWVSFAVIDTLILFRETNKDELGKKNPRFEIIEGIKLAPTNYRRRKDLYGIELTEEGKDIVSTLLGKLGNTALTVSTASKPIHGLSLSWIPITPTEQISIGTILRKHVLKSGGTVAYKVTDITSPKGIETLSVIRPNGETYSILRSAIKPDSFSSPANQQEGEEYWRKLCLKAEEKKAEAEKAASSQS